MRSKLPETGEIRKNIFSAFVFGTRALYFPSIVCHVRHAVSSFTTRRVHLAEKSRSRTPFFFFPRQLLFARLIGIISAWAAKAVTDFVGGKNVERFPRVRFNRSPAGGIRVSSEVFEDPPPNCVFIVPRGGGRLFILLLLLLFYNKNYVLYNRFQTTGYVSFPRSPISCRKRIGRKKV